MILIINDHNLGDLDDGMLEKVFEKYKTRDITEIAIRYMKEIIRAEADDLSVEDIIKRANFVKNNSGYKTIADLINVHMRSDLRPANEVCKNCDSYHDGLCVNWLMDVDPFTKGNSCWHEREPEDNVTSIDLAYVKYGDDLSFYDEPAEEQPPKTEEKSDNKVVEFTRPRWIIREEKEEELTIDDIKAYLKEQQTRDPKEVSAEIKKEATEHFDSLEVPGTDKFLIKENKDRFIEISGYLSSCWIMIRRYGIFSMRNVTEKTAGTEDFLIQHINDQIEHIIEGDFVDKRPADPLDDSVESVMTAYANLLLGCICAGENPRRIKDVVRRFVDKSNYQQTVDAIEQYTKRYEWLREGWII